MSKYEEIKTGSYCIQKLKCRCDNCNNNFIEFTTLNYELTCFKDNEGNKLYLPTYGKYGYLDLLEKLVKEWNLNKKITPKIMDRFEVMINKITPNNISFCQKIKCPKCKNDDICILARDTLLNHPIDWVKIDKEKLNIIDIKLKNTLS